MGFCRGQWFLYAVIEYYGFGTGGRLEGPVVVPQVGKPRPGFFSTLNPGVELLLTEPFLQRMLSVAS